jgi:hypothetical protein
MSIALRLLFCSIIATVVSLTTHIYVIKWLHPYLEQTMAAMQQADPPYYSWFVIGSAYLTATLIMGVYTFLYYHTQDLIPGKNKITKTIIVIALLFCIKGDLLRAPIMDLILNTQVAGLFTAAKFVILNYSDKWLANSLLAATLVYLCPSK